MIDPKKITPLLNNMTVDRKLAKGPTGDVYQVTRRMDGKKLALKHISVPSTGSETRALIYTGAVKDEPSAHRYYTSQVKELKNELLLLNGIKNSKNLLKFRGYQVDQKYTGVGYDIYLLSDYYLNLQDYNKKHPLTKLQAVNLGIDLCAALEQLRSAGLIHKDIQPSNVFYGSGGHFLIGDLGLAQLSELQYSSIPDAMISVYTAPEVQKGDAVLSENMDIYSVGVILYEVYNGGELPLTEKGKLAQSSKEPLTQPQYADTAISDIILRACAKNPSERYQDPGEMKQALVLYLQRNSVLDEPLVPKPVEPKPEQDPSDATVDVAEIAATVAAGQGAILGEAPTENESACEVEATAEVPNRIIEEINPLTPENCKEMTVETFMATLRKSAGLEVYSMDEDGDLTTVPGYETEETLPEDTQFVDSADTHLEVLQNVAAQDAVEPAIADESTPEISDLDDEAMALEQELLDEPLLQDPEQDAEEGASIPTPVEEQQPPVRRHKRRVPRNNDVDTYDTGDAETEEEDDDEEEEAGGSAWKKALIAIIVLLVLAGGVTTLYLFKTDTVSDMQSEVLSSTSVGVSASLKNDTAAEIVATSTNGDEVARVPFEEAGTTITGLNPNTTYSFTLDSTDGKFLLGSKTVSAKTREMTNITAFSPTAIGAVSVTVALGGVGPQPDAWVINLTSDSGENLSFETSEIPETGILLDGLTPDTHYTATITTDTGDTLGGTTSCDFTTMAYTELQSFEETSVSTDSLTVQWSYSGTVPETWTVTYEGSDGSSDSQDVTGTECTFSGLTSGVTYAITLSTPSLKATELSAISVGIPSITVSSVSSSLDDDGNVVVNWEYTGDVTPSEWRIAYVYNTSDGIDVTPTTVTTDTNSITLSDLIPNTSYTITVVGADELSVGGEASTTCQTADATDFTEFGCHDVSMNLYIREDNESSLQTPSDTFTTSQHIAFSIKASYDASEDDKNVSTTYVIRDANGNPFLVFNSTRSWNGTWTVANHTGDLPNPITTPGTYTMEVYFNGSFMASSTFTVIE